MNQSKQQRNEKNKEKELLKEYLNQYYTCRMKRMQLERRLRSIHEEMNMPIGGYKYSPINYGGTNTVGTGAASFIYRISEIETPYRKTKEPNREGTFKSHGYYGFLGGKQYRKNGARTSIYRL